tara:strand:+ start:98 stop:526 length:429 start_codon:yes stop_codon:yes gene_type:complete
MTKTKKYLFIIILMSILNMNGITKENFFSEGVKLFNEKKFPESKFKFEQDIVFNPKSEDSYLYLAKIFKERENDELQEQNLNTVILINPQNEEALYLLTLLNIKKSDYEKSDRLIKKFNKVCNKICAKKSELILKLKTLETN